MTTYFVQIPYTVGYLIQKAMRISQAMWFVFEFEDVAKILTL